MIADRVAAVRERIARAAERAGRAVSEVTLVAVSKTFPAEAVREAAAAGVMDFGENKVQEAEAKLASLSDLRASLRWHLVGHLQSNKAKKAAALFDCIHSLDGAELARKLAGAVPADRPLDVLVQVDLANEATKFGAEETDLFPVLESVRESKTLNALGLMVLPPFYNEPERARGYFRRLRELRDKALAAGLLAGSQLSMGMSHDFEVAIEEGATLVRVGTSIFGQRAKPAN